MPGLFGAQGRGAIEQSIFGQLKDLGGRDVGAIGAIASYSHVRMTSAYSLTGSIRRFISGNRDNVITVVLSGAKGEIHESKRLLSASGLWSHIYGCRLGLRGRLWGQY